MSDRTERDDVKFFLINIIIPYTIWEFLFSSNVPLALAKTSKKQSEATISKLKQSSEDSGESYIINYEIGIYWNTRMWKRNSK